MEEETWLIALGSGGGGQQRRTLPGKGGECHFSNQKWQCKAGVRSPPDPYQRVCALMAAWETQAQTVRPGRGLQEPHNKVLQ